VEYTYATDDEALAGFKELSETEGLIPALELARDCVRLESCAQLTRQ